ncbi:MAG TPA: hypothetical protein PKW63_06345 [Vicinamibacterales bacterium]|jgi:hypothetical protein|nr:hypothetical protein [Acidobacteriota bacterium]HQX81359.1 hypothetical protein [Vicinamibacterales bacterium]
MITPTPRVWIATFVGLVFTIGLLTGIVVERTWLRRAGSSFQGRFGGGPGGPGSPGGPSRGGPGSGQGRGGPGRGGSMFGAPSQQYVDDLSREVTLTDAQRAEVLTLLQAQETRLRTMQDDARKVFIQEQEGLHDKIAAVLSPAQAETFRKWVTTRTGRGRGGR